MLTPLLNIDLFFRNNDNMVISVTFSHDDWAAMSLCNVLGGLVSTSFAIHAYCQVASKNTLLLRGFKGF